MTSYTVQRLDCEGGEIAYRVYRGEQIVCEVDEAMFVDPIDALAWADRIKLALVQLERAVR